MCYSGVLSRDRWYLALFFLASLTVRLFYANSLYFNPDECLHINAGSSAQWGVYHHPPLLFWWLWTATLVSGQEWWLRLAPSVAGALTPVLTVLWLRRWMHPVTAWGLGLLAAFAPSLVLLSIQLRGYSLALAAITAALYTLDRAFAETSRRWLWLHFAALSVAILAEFMTAWIALALGLYGILRLLREPALRPLVAPWVAGQTACAGIYAALYWIVVRPVLERTNAPELIQTYLRGGFPQPGENLLVFLAAGSFKQAVYFAGSLPGGLLAAGLILLGLGIWLQQRDSRALLILALALTAAGAMAQFYPYGRSRHTVAIGLVCLGALGAGVEVLARRWPVARWALPSLLLALSFFAPLPDVHNIDLAGWSKPSWDRSVDEMRRRVPSGATILADDEAFQMLQANFSPRNLRYQASGAAHQLQLEHFTVKSLVWEWRNTPVSWVTEEARHTTGGVWLIDTGFDIGAAKAHATKLGAETVWEQPGVMYLARLR